MSKGITYICHCGKVAYAAGYAFDGHTGDCDLEPEYIATGKQKDRLKLMWDYDNGWQSYIKRGNDWESGEKLSTKQVREWLADKAYKFIAVVD